MSICCRSGEGWVLCLCLGSLHVRYLLEGALFVSVGADRVRLCNNTFLVDKQIRTVRAIMLDIQCTVYQIYYIELGEFKKLSLFIHLTKCTVSFSYFRFIAFFIFHYDI